MDKYSGFSASSQDDLEVVTYKVNAPVENLPIKIKIGKPVWIFSTVPNPDRKWWQFWKPLRMVHPDWKEFFEYSKTRSEEVTVI